MKTMLCSLFLLLLLTGCAAHRPLATVWPEIVSAKIVSVGDLHCASNQHVEGDGKTEAGNHCVDDVQTVRAHHLFGLHWFPSCNAQNAGRVVTIHANGDWQRCELSGSRYVWIEHTWNPVDWQGK